jgi:hypothetical protein
MQGIHMCARCVSMDQHVFVLNVGRFLRYEVEDTCTCVSSMSVDFLRAYTPSPTHPPTYTHTYTHSVRVAIRGWIPEAASVCRMELRHEQGYGNGGMGAARVTGW